MGDMVQSNPRKTSDGYQSTPHGFALGLGVAGFALFLVTTGLVQARVLHSFDFAAGLAVLPMASERLDVLSSALSIAFSGEFSLLYAIVFALLLWWRRYGLWSLAPFAFLAPNVLEVLMKATVNQPAVPPELHRSVFYPLASVQLSGTFPSGHSMRGAFLCTFLAALLGPRGNWRRGAALSLALLAGLIAFTRVYLGDHWLSDVIGGLLLGVSTAALAVSPGARRLARRLGATWRQSKQS